MESYLKRSVTKLSEPEGEDVRVGSEMAPDVVCIPLKKTRRSG
jgi:hypothetical protein